MTRYQAALARVRKAEAAHRAAINKVEYVGDVFAYLVPPASAALRRAYVELEAAEAWLASPEGRQHFDNGIRAARIKEGLCPNCGCPPVGGGCSMFPRFDRVVRLAFCPGGRD
jgi:hypothetical protein